MTLAGDSDGTKTGDGIDRLPEEDEEASDPDQETSHEESLLQSPPQFAPGTPTDGRAKFDFESRYVRSAWVQISLEAVYLLAIFTGSATLLLLFGPGNQPPWPGLLDQDEWQTARPYCLAFVGGALGGTLFAMKWLYHSVAKGLWNRDRILWRLFTPILSAGAATTLIVLSISGVLPLFGRELAQSPAGSLGIALITGFFSDRAFSLFENTIQSLFGPHKGLSGNQKASVDV